jgi:hypothetical protein
MCSRFNEKQKELQGSLEIREGASADLVMEKIIGED